MLPPRPRAGRRSLPLRTDMHNGARHAGFDTVHVRRTRQGLARAAGGDVVFKEMLHTPEAFEKDVLEDRVRGRVHGIKFWVCARVRACVRAAKNCRRDAATRAGLSIVPQRYVFPTWKYGCRPGLLACHLRQQQEMCAAPFRHCGCPHHSPHS